MTLAIQSGGTTFPLDPADFTDTLAPLDPARDTLLDLFEAAFVAELGTVWTTVAANVDALSGSSVVQNKWPGPPTADLLQSTKFGFPALFLYRDGSATAEEYTLAQDQVTQNWVMDYVLPPLSADDFRRVGDVFVGLMRIVQKVIRRKGHPSYQSGALVTTGVGLSTLECTGHQTGPAKFSADSPVYPAISFRLKSTELTDFLDGEHGEFRSFDLDAGTGNSDGLVNPLVTADSDQELQSPAITGSSALYAKRSTQV